MKVLISDRVGLGPLVELLRQRLEVVWAGESLDEAGLEHMAQEGSGLVVGMSRSSREALELGQRAARLRLAHLPVVLEWEGARVLVGPREQPGVPGCLQCLLLRQSETGFPVSIEARSPRHSEVSPPGWYEALATLVHRGAVGQASTVHELERRTLHVTSRHLLPVGRCACGAAARGPEEGTRFSAHAGFERRPLSSLYEVERLVDERLGPILNTRQELESRHIWPTVSAQAAVSDVGMRVYGIGRAPSFFASRRVAILEALERYCGLVDRTGRPRVEGSWRELGERALDPRRVGLYTPEQYATPGFSCRPFQEDAPLTWVQGWSVTHGRPLLVPSELAFYGETAKPVLVAESSNGCSMGSSPEDALLFGLLELIERDAMMRLWYQAYAAPRLELSTGMSRTALVLRERMAREGYEILAFDATSDLGLPVALVVALRTRGEGAAVLCASGAHPRLTMAVEKALSELAPMAAWGSALSQEEWARAEVLAREPERVRSIGDHMLAVALPSARQRLAFLLEGSTPPRSCVDSVSPDTDLAALVRRLAAGGFEVVAVDQTAPELRARGLFCVRAIVPGLIPIYYGESLRRVVPGGRGGERWATRPPHPFS